jgi:diguanylate cyclase (GGDEF)-like protein
MKELSDSKGKKELTKESIIGLGEASFRKNYYSELQERLQELERINTRARALIATIPDFLLVCGESDEIRIFSEATKRKNMIIDQILKDSSIMEELRKIISDVRDARRMIAYDFTYRIDGSIYYFEARVNLSEYNEPLIIIRDITERMQMELRLREMAELDSLTKLYNRNFFMEKLDRYEGKEIENFTLLLIDIDGLKLVNDTLGHLCGDSIIIGVAEILNFIFGEYGFVSRVGGDEFGIVLIGYSPDEVERLLEKMTKTIDEHNERRDLIKISVSSGYACQRNGRIRTNSMFQEADNNMYQNKLLKETSNRNSLVKALMKTLEVKDYITEGHADRLEALSLEMAKALKLPQHQVDRIKLLAKFHDIGKVGIPDGILTKPSNLSSEEWVIMKSHSGIGKRIAEVSPELRDISNLIYHHHERFDGAGYPMGLSGQDIPIECRILSIVDTFDAMTNDRPYRKAQSAENAVAEIVRCAGTQFDSHLADIFVSQVLPIYSNC